jgi:HEAT repeat protein
VTETPTDAQEATAEAGLDWSDPSTLPIGEVKELFVMLGKALRAQQLYDENNPVYQRFVSQFAGAVGRLWDRMDRLLISVDEASLTWMGYEVYTSSSRADSLAFLLFKDGIREFTLLEGLEGEELPVMLQVLNRARDLRPEGDDLLTVLWEKDLQFFTYQFVDLLADGVVLPGEAKGGRGGSGAPEGVGNSGNFKQVLEQELPETVEAEEEKAEGAEESDESPQKASADDFNPTLYSLDPSEMARMQEEIQEEMARDLRGDVLAALFDRVEEPRFPERQQEILEIFRTLLPNFLSRGALKAAGNVLEEVSRLLDAEGALKDEQKAYGERILEEVSSESTLNELIQALEDGSISPNPAELAAFLRHLKAGALEPLLRGAEEAEDKGIKTIIQDAVMGIAQKYRASVIQGMESSDPVVAAGACSLAGKMQLSEAAAGVAHLLDHADPRVRLAAVEAAVDLKASTAVGALQDALEDRDREVRIAAARGLGTLNYRPSVPYFRSIIERKAIRQADISEQIAFFENYGLLQDPEGVKLLDGMLNGRGFLGKKESGEIRACAALGLGKMGTPEAQTSLRKAQDEQDPVVRSAVNRALRGEG